MNGNELTPPEDTTSAERLELELKQIRREAIENLTPEIADFLQSNNPGDETLWEVMAEECMNDFKLARLIAQREGLVARLRLEGYDKNLSESKIMISRGYYRIYDCGSSVWKLITSN